MAWGSLNYESTRLMVPCTASEAAAFVERLWRAWPEIPNQKVHDVYFDEMSNLFSRYSAPEGREAVNAAIGKFKKRPTIAHIAELLESNREKQKQHDELIDRYKGPRKRYIVKTRTEADEFIAKSNGRISAADVDVEVERDQQTSDERAAFIEATLARHGLSADIAARRAHIDAERALSNLCHASGVDPASLPNAPPRQAALSRHAADLGDWKKLEMPT